MVREEVAERIERWIVPVVRWIRRTLWVPVAAGVLAAAVLVWAALEWRGVDGDGFGVALVAAAIVAVPVVGVALFRRVLGELENLPATVRAAPDNVGAVRDELLASSGEVRDLHRTGLLGVPSALRWLRRALGRLDDVGVAGVAAAVAALHPLRLAWVLVWCWLAVMALPAAALALLLAVRA